VRFHTEQLALPGKGATGLQQTATPPSGGNETRHWKPRGQERFRYYFHIAAPLRMYLENNSAAICASGATLERRPIEVASRVPEKARDW